MAQPRATRMRISASEPTFRYRTNLIGGRNWPHPDSQGFRQGLPESMDPLIPRPWVPGVQPHALEESSRTREMEESSRRMTLLPAIATNGHASSHSHVGGGKAWLPAGSSGSVAGGSGKARRRQGAAPARANKNASSAAAGPQEWPAARSACLRIRLSHPARASTRRLALRAERRRRRRRPRAHLRADTSHPDEHSSAVTHAGRRAGRRRARPAQPVAGARRTVATDHAYRHVRRAAGRVCRPSRPPPHAVPRASLSLLQPSAARPSASPARNLSRASAPSRSPPPPSPPSPPSTATKAAARAARALAHGAGGAAPSG